MSISEVISNAAILAEAKKIRFLNIFREMSKSFDLCENRMKLPCTGLNCLVYSVPASTKPNHTTLAKRNLKCWPT